ncbi:type I restriction endonuclease subunit M [Acidovorax sp. YS12]|nr:type I restriction endonuclease subunit M [Acidovorax sp. YS12]
MTSSPGQAAALARHAQQRRPLFPLGQVLITPGALDMLEALALAPLPFVLRHVSGDWGELCDEDKASNAAALTYGSRVLSAYDIAPNHRLWIITEADRRSTTLLLPEEY